MRIGLLYFGIAVIGGVTGYIWEASRVGCRQIEADLVDCYKASATGSVIAIAVGMIAGLVLASLLHRARRLTVRR